MQHSKQKIRDVFFNKIGMPDLKIQHELDFYINIANFKYLADLDILTLANFQQNLTRLGVASHRLEVECGHWTRPKRTPLDERKCKICHKLEDEF